MSARSITSLFLFTLVAAAAALAMAAQPFPATSEWPQWRGPERNGISRETGLLKQWPPEGPPLVWKATNLGGGYSTPSVAGGRIFGMGYRGEEEVVWALNAADGKEIWSVPIGRRNGRVGYDEGPRCTPTVDGNLVYALGISGDLVCLTVADGQLRWRKNLANDFGGAVLGWCDSESPLVDGEQLIVTPGGRSATLAALNKRTGEVIWMSPIGDAAQYSSAIVAEVGGIRQYIQFLRGGVVGVAAKDGRFLWRYAQPANGTANIATPIFHDQHVFAASAYNTGGGLARLSANGENVTVTEVYFTREMRNHHGGIILVNGYLYGFDNATLTCLDFKTGEVKWADRSVGKGSLVYADGHLYVRSERGPVALVEATPAGYREKGRFSQPERSNRNAWPHPVIAGGRLYLRDQDLLLCYDVKER